MKQPVPERRGFDVFAKLIGVGFGRLRGRGFLLSNPEARRAVHLPGSKHRILGEVFLDTVSSLDTSFVYINPRLKHLRVFPRQHGRLRREPMLQGIKPRPVWFLLFLHICITHRIRFHKSPCRLG